MAKEKDLPPGDARQAKVAPHMEYEAPKEVLPIDKRTDNDTPHFQFIFF